MDEIIEVSGVSKKFKVFESKLGQKKFLASLRRRYYDKVALDNVGFTIKKGEAVAILGRNGSGKSTMIKILTGILYPDKGSVRVMGFDPWTDRQKLALRAGVVFGKQDALYWNLPAIDSFDFVRRLYRVPEKDYKRRLDYLIGALSLEDVYRRQVRTLSLGERMKCSFISSVLHQPELVFLDEPTVGVDLPSSIALRKTIVEMRNEYGTTFVLTTHIVEDVEAMSERVIMMDQGKKVFDGSKTDMKHIFGNKKQLKLYLAKDAKVRVNSYGHVLEQKGSYVKIEIDADKLKSRKITELLNGENVLDYNVSEPGLGLILEKLYARKAGKTGKTGKARKR